MNQMLYNWWGFTEEWGTTGKDSHKSGGQLLGIHRRVGDNWWDSQKSIE
jgi:hypothetical protein